MPQAGEIAGYQVIRELGRGGMGAVFEVEKDGRRLALKLIINPDIELHQRFLREAQAQARVDSHPHIARVHASGDSPSGPFLVMELLAGPDLATLLKQRGLLPWDEVKNYLIQICSALERLHSSGLIHRDLKAANIMLRSPGHAVLCDFGLVAIAGAERLTQTGTSLGTPYAMAPEQLFAEPLDHRADIWALGVLAYELLSAQKPFSGASGAALAQNLSQARYTPIEQLVPGLPNEARLFISKSLQSRPSDRWISAEAASAALVAPTTQSRSPLLLAGAAIIGLILGLNFLHSNLLHAPSKDQAPLSSANWKKLEDKARTILSDHLSTLALAALRHRPQLWNLAPSAPPTTASTSAYFSRPPVELLPDNCRTTLHEISSRDLRDCPPELSNLALLLTLSNPAFQFTNEKTNNSTSVRLWRELLSPKDPNPKALRELSELLNEVSQQPPELSDPYLLLRSRLQRCDQRDDEASRDLRRFLFSLDSQSQLTADDRRFIQLAEQKLWRQLSAQQLRSARSLALLLSSPELEKRPIADWDWLNQQLKTSFTPEAEKNSSTSAEAERYVTLIDASDQRLALTWPKASDSVLQEVIEILKKRNDSDAQCIIELLRGPNFDIVKGQNLALIGEFERKHMEGREFRQIDHDYERRMALRMRSLLEHDILTEPGLLRRFGNDVALNQLAPRTSDPLNLAIYSLMAGELPSDARPGDHLFLTASLIQALPAIQSANLTNLECFTRRQIYFNLRILLLGHGGALPDLCEHLAALFQVSFPAPIQSPAKLALPNHSPACDLSPWLEREQHRVNELLPKAWQPDRLFFDFSRVYFAWTENCGDPSPDQSRRQRSLQLMIEGEALTQRAYSNYKDHNIAPAEHKQLAVEAWNYGLQRAKIYEKLGKSKKALETCEATFEKILQLVGLSYYEVPPPEYCHFREFFIELTKGQSEKDNLRARFTKLEKDTLNKKPDKAP